MPAESKSQKRLMGMVYAYKTGELDISEMPETLQNKIKGMAKGMSKKELKDFIDTPAKNLPDKVKNENITPGSIPGMGSIKLPGDPGNIENFGDQAVGSGDSPIPKKVKKKKKKNKHIKNLEDFLQEDMNI